MYIVYVHSKSFSLETLHLVYYTYSSFGLCSINLANAYCIFRTVLAIWQSDCVGLQLQFLEYVRGTYAHAVYVTYLS